MGGHGLHVVVLLVATVAGRRDVEGAGWDGWEWMVSVWSFPTEERAQQNHASHSHARQDPAVEALLALPALGCCIVPVEVHKSVLQGEEKGRCYVSPPTVMRVGGRKGAGPPAYGGLGDLKN